MRKLPGSNHADICGKACEETHIYCDWKGCAAMGEHFASDHISIYALARAEGK